MNVKTTFGSSWFKNKLTVKLKSLEIVRLVYDKFMKRNQYSLEEM